MNLRTEEDLLMVPEALAVPAAVHAEPIAEAVLLLIQMERERELEEKNAA